MKEVIGEVEGRAALVRLDTKNTPNLAAVASGNEYSGAEVSFKK